jgi:flagellar hook-basal body complex protein FliE
MESIQSISSVLDQMRTVATQAAGGASGVGAANSVTGAVSAGGGTDFASVLKTSLDKVSSSQDHALQQAHAFEMGAPDVALNDVMVDMQKANINFQMATQVRNKLVSAYNDVMQMQV